MQGGCGRGKVNLDKGGHHGLSAMLPSWAKMTLWLGRTHLSNTIAWVLDAIARVLDAIAPTAAGGVAPAKAVAATPSAAAPGLHARSRVSRGGFARSRPKHGRAVTNRLALRENLIEAAVEIPIHCDACTENFDARAECTVDKDAPLAGEV